MCAGDEVCLIVGLSTFSCLNPEVMSLKSGCRSGKQSVFKIDLRFGRSDSKDARDKFAASLPHELESRKVERSEPLSEGKASAVIRNV